jgi:hypothetical protein
MGSSPSICKSPKIELPSHPNETVKLKENVIVQSGICSSNYPSSKTIKQMHDEICLTPTIEQPKKTINDDWDTQIYTVNKFFDGQIDYARMRMRAG